MKNNLELLKIVKNHRRKFDCSIGLCSIAYWCKSGGLITQEEYKKIMKILKAHKPKDVCMGDHWFHWDGIERGKFLNKLIKKYDRK